MTQPFRLAIAGAGMITVQSHLPAALSTPDIELTAIIDPVASRAESLASDYGISPRIEQDIRRVLDEVDGVVIATPNHTHQDIAVTCLDAGVGVLIEKPLTNSVAEGETILAAAERTKSVLAVGYVTRFYENIQLLNKLLVAGYFGKVTRFVHQFGTAGGWAPVSGYILDKEAAGGGVLMVTASHFIDRMLHVWGYPTSMRYLDDASGGPEANCYAELGFLINGEPVSGYLRYSKTVGLPKGLVIETELGIVTLQDSPDADIMLRPHDVPTLTHVIRETTPNSVKQQDPFALQLDDFVAACRDGRPPMIDGQQGLDSVRLISDLYSQREPIHTNWYETSCA